MSSRKEISIDIRKLLIKHRNENKSYGEIAKILNLSRSTVQTIIENFNKTGAFHSKERTGRPKKLSRRDIGSILKEVKKNPRISAPKLADQIAQVSNKSVHPRTIKRALNDNGFFSRTPRKKPLISEKNRRLRLEFARAHIDKGMDFWSKVLFTDESKYNIFGSDGRAKIWRKRNADMQLENLMPSVKHGGGSVMVWGAIAASGVGKLAFVEGIMDQHKYKSILEQHLMPSVECLGLGEGWIFQQDNDPKHTARMVKEWLLYHAPRQLNSPPQSPDLNPIEHVWELLERKIRQTKITDAKSLKNALIKAWNKITPEEVTNLVSSMPRRLQAVIDNAGGPTKY